MRYMIKYALISEFETILTIIKTKETIKFI